MKRKLVSVLLAGILCCSTAVEVSAAQPHDGRCLLHVVVTDATGTPYSYDHFVRVGA